MIRTILLALLVASTAIAQLENEFIGNLLLYDGVKIKFGTDGDFQELFDTSDVRLEWRDADGNDMMRLTDAGTTGNLHVTGNVTFGGSLTGGFKLPDDTDLIFGTDDDIRVRYDEAGDDRLEFHDGTNLLAYVRDAGTTGDLGVTGSLLANTIAVHSGSTATLYNSATAITMGATSGSLTLRNPTITLAPGAGATTFNQTGAQLVFAQTPGAGVGALIDFIPTPDSTSPANVRFFRLTNTTGDRLVTFFVGNGAGDIGYRFRTRTAAQGSPVFDIFNGAAGASAVKISLFGSGDGTFAGDLAVNGGDLTSTATNFGLLTAPTGTLTAFSNFTTVNLGNNTSAVWTLVGTSFTVPASLQSAGTTQNLFTSTVNTVNLGPGAATGNLNFSTINSNQSSITYFASPTTNTLFGNSATNTVRGLTRLAYDGTNNVSDDILIVRKTTSDVAQVNMGAAIAFELENADTPGDDIRAGRINTFWTTSTASIENSSMYFNVMAGGSEITILKLIGAGSQGPQITTDYDLVMAKRFMHTPPAFFASNDTTPSVAGGNFFVIPDTWTSGNNITALDDGYAGQMVIIAGGDSDCVIVDGGTLILAGNWTAASNAMLTLIYSGSNWYELSRSAN